MATAIVAALAQSTTTAAAITTTATAAISTSTTVANLNATTTTPAPESSCSSMCWLDFGIAFLGLSPVNTSILIFAVALVIVLVIGILLCRPTCCFGHSDGDSEENRDLMEEEEDGNEHKTKHSGHHGRRKK